MCILFEASLLAIALCTLSSIFASPPHFHTFLFYLHIPFLFTVHLTIVHNMIPSQTVTWLGTELDGLQFYQSVLVSCLYTSCPAVTALHSRSVPLSHGYQKSFPRENSEISISLESNLYLALHPDIFLVLSLYEGNRSHGVQFSEVGCFLFSSAHSSVPLSIPPLLQFYPCR